MPGGWSHLDHDCVRDRVPSDLRHSRPLDIVEITLPSGATLRVPTPDETLRVEGDLIAAPNRVRGFLDIAALAELSRYRGLAARWHDWGDVRVRCAALAAAMLDAP